LKFLSYTFYQKLIISIIFLIIFEDLFRKFIPGNSPFFFLVKDLLIILLYFGFLIQITKGGAKVFRVAFLPSLIILFFYSLISLIWFDNYNILVFLNGLKIDFFYIPILFIVPYTFNNHKFIYSVNKLVKNCLFILFFFQIFEILASDYATGLKIYNLSDSYDRVFHTGHSFGISGWITYYKAYFFSAGKFGDMVFHLYLLFLITTLALNKISSKNIIIISILTLSMLIMAGKRIFIITMPLLFLAFIFFIKNKNKLITKSSLDLFITFKKIKSLMKHGLFLLIIILITLYYSNKKFKQTSQFVFQALNYGISNRFIKDDSHYRLEFNRLMNEEHLWRGQGVGTITLGVQVFEPRAESKYSLYESGYIKFINEHGLIGFFIFCSLLYSTFIFDIKTINVSKRANLEIISKLILLYHLIILIRYANGHQFFGSSQTVFWFWFITGIQLMIYREGKYGEKKSIIL
jgi:hypothetical protein